jgi:flagellar M-ring protein FliF
MESEAKIRGGLGFELFDKSDFGMTEFVQKINYQRALQGELARTINSLEEVKFARVHLVMPESSLFSKHDEAASASVTLFLRDGETLNPKRIVGIQKLVSSSVPGLQQSNVTIVNQDGETMSGISKEAGELVSISERLQRKKEVETHLTEKVSEVLEKAFGPHQALVSIDATINFDQVKTTKEMVLHGDDGNGSVVRKREVSSGGKAKSLTKETEYRLGSRVDQITFAPGDIKKLSVGVLVPDDTSEERIYKIQDLVAMAVGLNERRGDEIV